MGRLPWRLKMNQMLNNCSKLGSNTGNKFGVLALLFTTIKYGPAKFVPIDFEEDALNIISATSTGAFYKIGTIFGKQRKQLLRYSGLGFALSVTYFSLKPMFENY